MLGVEMRQCPRLFIGDDAGRVLDILDAAEWAKEKILPCGGGLGDQTAAGMDAIRVAWRANEMIDELKESGKKL